MAVGATGFFHLGLVEVSAPVDEFAADLAFDAPELRVVALVVFLDDLESPAAGQDVAAHQLGGQLLGEVDVPGLAQHVHGRTEREIGAAGELVEAVEVSAGTFGGLQRLGQFSDGRHGRGVDAGGPLVTLGRLSVVGHVPRLSPVASCVSRPAGGIGEVSLLSMIGGTMNYIDENDSGGSRVRIPRSRGAVGGLAVLLLGVWGALIPFLGPYFDFAFTPDDPWAWTSARGWLEVLPGVVAIVGGLLMLMSRNRVVASAGGWLAVAAGTWFVIGPFLADLLRLGDLGEPVATGDLKRALLHLTYFYGLGALILFFAATSLGRLSVRSARDIAFARREAVVGAGGDRVVVDDQVVVPDDTATPEPHLRKPDVRHRPV